MTILSLVVAACAGASAPPEDLRYQAVEFDLCERIDLSPLDPLELSVWEERPATRLDLEADGVEQVSMPGSCIFVMRSGDGHHASLAIRSYAESSIADAESTFERRSRRAATLGGSGMSREAVEGLGEHAVAYRRDRSDPLFSSAPSRPAASRVFGEYLLLALVGNLVVEVHLGLVEAAPAILVEPARAMAIQTIEVYPPAAPPQVWPRRGRAYQSADLEPCADADISPTEEAFKVTAAPPLTFPPVVEGRVKCRIGMNGETDAEIRTVELTIGVQGYWSIASAEDGWARDASHTVGGSRWPWRQEAAPESLGERVEAHTRTRGVEGTNLIYSEYAIIVLDGNLVVVVELSVSGYVEVPVETLRQLTHAAARDVHAQVPLVPDA